MTADPAMEVGATTHSKNGQTMNLSAAEIEILIMEHIVDQATEHSTRMKRRAYTAEVEYSEALADEQRIRRALRDLREAYLARTI